MDSTTYCPSLFKYERWQTREVKIGEIGFGGNNPLRLQSMTTADTMNTVATVEESIRMIQAGCELVRITAPSKKDAANLEVIKADLASKGFDTPLVADIHFTPNAASEAAKHVEKIRVNPGNFADKKKFEEIDYTEESYQAELERIRTKFTPLVLECKELGRAMRIGTNHGSLSDRIMSRYGDTPLGMVESAMEFIRICEDNDYHELVISMKASNTKVMVQAYRLLVNHMLEAGMNYPLHLGVTEAGDGEDGRIKSAVGIGTLLEDGLGDTIRVSLTEAPEAEIPVARKLAQRYVGRENTTEVENNPLAIDPFNFSRRNTHSIENIGDHNVPVVVLNLSEKKEINASSLFGAGYSYSVPLDKWNIQELAADYVDIGRHQINFEIPGTLGLIQDLEVWKDKDRHYPKCGLNDLKKAPVASKLVFITCSVDDVNSSFIETVKQHNNLVLLLSTNHAHAMADLRSCFFKLINSGVSAPVVLSRDYKENEELFQLYSSTDCGALLLDGLGDGIALCAENVPLRVINSTSFGILQATRSRISKTEYISCPSCGRTLFDLQETTAKIRAKTSHLKGVKIGIMGCIVNGPGEMADADYGYVGTGVGKITLYKEKEVVQRNVPEIEAVDALIELIKTHGDWVEVPAEVDSNF